MDDDVLVHRSVSSSLTAEVLAPARIELQIAVAGASPHGEELRVSLDGCNVPVQELATDVGGRLHLLHCGPGTLEVSYRADVLARADPAPAEPLDAVVYLRPSRYCEADRLSALARAEFGAVVDPADLVRDVAAWVGRRLAYVSGSSAGTDGSVDALLAGAGVCRDFAHLTVSLLRARDVPARLVAVYAPGLSPMDFHAVVEALVEGRWRVVDPTLLAPRQSLLRIATGRDAADTAFLSSYGGALRLDRLSVSSVVNGVLPTDDLNTVQRLG